MLNSSDQAIAKTLKKRLLKEGVPIRNLTVFGSRARGDFSPDSDLDVCLIVETLNDHIERIVSRIAWEVGFQSNRIIATVEFTPEQIENSPLRASPLLHSIQKEGVPI